MRICRLRRGVASFARGCADADDARSALALSQLSAGPSTSSDSAANSVLQDRSPSSCRVVPRCLGGDGGDSDSSGLSTVLSRASSIASILQASSHLTSMPSFRAVMALRRAEDAFAAADSSSCLLFGLSDSGNCNTTDVIISSSSCLTMSSLLPLSWVAPADRARGATAAGVGENLGILEGDNCSWRSYGMLLTAWMQGLPVLLGCC